LRKCFNWEPEIGDSVLAKDRNRAAGLRNVRDKDRIPGTRRPVRNKEEMKDHKDLDVWKAGVDLVTQVYAVTIKFPKEELYGLTSQIRRSAVSIPSNISEGAARNSEKEFVQFLYIALGSASELETQIIITDRLKYIENPHEILEKLTSVIKLINGLIRHYRNKACNRDQRAGADEE
jgi:four helix bundle protein